jgi:hypothetical protein
MRKCVAVRCTETVTLMKTEDEVEDEGVDEVEAIQACGSRDYEATVVLTVKLSIGDGGGDEEVNRALVSKVCV